MFQVAVARDFIAQHYLIGGDWGAENELHSHHYQIELILDGEELDQHGYLVDIVDIEAALDALIERYRDQTLNDLPDFAGVNPSIERFSRILCQSITTNIRTTHLNAITVRL
ncbi:MAG: 6-pyruvoyl trahydropterin synthase family protein [Anaerolineales bacterium]